ncbi:hypothetical protein J5681_06290 [bacterium]|nr:hypothetical protein [bacterium]
MKKLCLLFVFCSLFIFAACGSDSKNDTQNDSEATLNDNDINDAEEVADNEGDTENQDADQGRKQGELYGECYPNETCNKGLICDVENNICIKDHDQNNDNDINDAEEVADNEGDTENQDPDQGRKQGELYGECYPNETCNKGLICDVENNICIKDHDQNNDNDTAPADDTEETPEEDTDSDETPDEDTDTDSDTNECTYNEEDLTQNKSCNEGVLMTCTEENTLESAECELGFGCKDDGSDCAECQNENSICTNNAAQIGSFKSCSNGTWSEETTCLNSFSCDPNNTGCGVCKNSTYKCTNGSNNVGRYQVCTKGAWPSTYTSCPNSYSCKGSSGFIGTSQADVCGVCKNSTLKCTNDSNGIGRYQVCTNGAWPTSNVVCPNNYSCKGSNGASIIGTSSATVCGECLNGSKRCVGNIAFQFCVSGAWSSSTNCQSGSSCQNGECVQQ